VISQFTPMLDRLSRNRGVHGSLVVSESDGMIVDANLRVGQRGDDVAALAAAVYRRARRASAAAGLGAPAFLQLDARRGHVCAVGAGDLVILVIAEPTANIGLLRVQLLAAARELA
jgi:predicted regulator of Ras-like GTPase activity (Roadblock/LC7/MglB family)